MFESVNWIAVVGAGILASALGALWYGPLFGKRWMDLTGRRPGEGQEGNWTPILVSIVMAIVGATALAALTAPFPNDIATAAFVGLLVWVASGLALKLNDMMYGGQSSGLFYLDSAYHLIALVLMAVIVSAFRI